MTSQWRTMIPILFLSISLWATAGSAEPIERHSTSLMQLLRGIDTVPSPAQLSAATAEPIDALFLVATDGNVPLYERRRAVSLLASFPTPQSEAYLTLLATVSVEMPIRWIAAYSYCRGWAVHAPLHVLAFTDWMLRSPAPEEREAVLLALRYVSSDAADTLLVQQRQREQTPRIRGVIDRVMRARQKARRPQK